MVDRLQEIVETLPHLAGVTGVRDVADRRHAQGEQVWQYGSVFDRVLRLLAAPPGNRRLHRYIASLLASGHSAEDLTVAFTRGGGAVPSALAALGLKVPGGCGEGGGAHTTPAGAGAYRRPAARQSLAGPSGAGRDASVAAVEARVPACAWFGFDASTPRFWQVAWDIGLAAVSPDRRRIAVPAATDTD